MVPADDGGSPAPVDRPILELLRERLVTTAQVSDATITDDGHLELRVTLSKSYYPDDVAAVTLSVRWYTNDDFKIHYHEQRSNEDWHCRWDRHPNPHNTRATIFIHHRTPRHPEKMPRGPTTIEKC